MCLTFFFQFVEHMVRTLKDSLKACNWDAARYALRFLADLVNCYVIAANSLLQMLDNLMDVAKEDGVPNVSISCITVGFVTDSSIVSL